MSYPFVLLSTFLELKVRLKSNFITLVQVGSFLVLAVYYSYMGGKELVYLILFLRTRLDICGILPAVI